jgi:hypothetical protein
MRHCLQSADKIKQGQTARDERRRRIGPPGFADKCKMQADANEAKWRGWAKAIEDAVAKLNSIGDAKNNHQEPSTKN